MCAMRGTGSVVDLGARPDWSSKTSCCPVLITFFNVYNDQAQKARSYGRRSYPMEAERANIVANHSSLPTGSRGICVRVRSFLELIPSCYSSISFPLPYSWRVGLGHDAHLIRISLCSTCGGHLKGFQPLIQDAVMSTYAIQLASSAAH